MIGKLEQQAVDRCRNLRELLAILKTTVPDFVALTSRPE